jgi:hypothetical protein
MTHVVVFASPPGVMSGVRSVLHDWSAAGLVNQFGWVEPGGVRDRDAMALWFDRGRQAGGPLSSAIGEIDPEEVSLCVLVPVLEGTSVLTAEMEEHIAAMVAGAVGARGPAAAPGRARGREPTVTRVRCVVGRPGKCDPGAVVAAEGWHNVVIGPEEAQGWVEGAGFSDGTNDPIDIGSHVAAVVAGLTGLWTGADAARIGGGTAPGRSARLVRSSYRNLDAQDLEVLLRDAVLATAAELPRPREHGTSAVYVEDLGRATSEMAAALWSRHAAALRGPRQKVVVAPAKRIGALKAIALFFSFMSAAIRGAPGAWLRRKRAQGATRVAKWVQGVVFGSGESAYAVVVDGMTPAGRPASWLDLAEAAASIEVGGAVRIPGAGEHTQLSGLWSDYAAGALTLADGGDRVSEMPPVQVGANRAVARRAGDVVPSADMVFPALAGELGALVGREAVQAFDVLGARRLDSSLAAIAAREGVQLSADRARQELRSWCSDHAASYAVAVGTRLAEMIARTTQELRSYLAVLEQAHGHGPGEEEEADQRRFLREAKRLALFLAGLSCAIVLLVAFGVIGPLRGLLAFAVVALGGVTGAFVMFCRSQRRLFQFMNRRRQALTMAEAAEANLRQATIDLRRQTGAYGQFLSWSEVLGAFLARPLDREHRPVARKPRLDGALPRCMCVGAIDEVDRPAVARVARELRSNVFRRGWLSEPWETLMSNAPARLGPEATEELEVPARLYGMRGGPGSLLSTWAASVAAQGPGPGAGDAAWAEVMEQLERSQVTEVLLDRINIPGRPGSGPMSLEKFMSGAEDGPRGRGSFTDSSVVSPRAAIMDRGLEVDQVLAGEKRLGLSRISVLTELSHSIPEYELRLGPDLEAAEVPQPEVPQPEVPQPEVPQPEVPQPEVPQPEVAQPEVPAAGRQGTSGPVAGGPGPPGSTTSKPGTPRSTTSKLGTPRSGTPRSGTPRSGTPEPGAPEPGGRGATVNRPRNRDFEF